jgi:hypothetical protein
VPLLKKPMEHIVTHINFPGSFWVGGRRMTAEEKTRSDVVHIQYVPRMYLKSTSHPERPRNHVEKERGKALVITYFSTFCFMLAVAPEGRREKFMNNIHFHEYSTILTIQIHDEPTS